MFPNENMSSMYLYKFFVFFEKSTTFFLTISYKKNNIRRRKLRYNSDSRVFSSNSNILLFKTNLAKYLMERGKIFPMWYVRGKMNNIHCTKNCSHVVN